MITYVVVSLGEILEGDIKEEKLCEVFKKFSCQRETDLEDFLVHKAIVYEKGNIGKTFLFLDAEKLENNEIEVIAYYTIAQGSLDISQMSNSKKRKVLGSYPGRDRLSSIPTYLIGQLGRSDAYSNDDLSGEQILKECYNSISIAARVVGGEMVVLECREQMFSKFYEKKGYRKFYAELSQNNLYTLYKKINFVEYWKRSLVTT